MLDFICWSFPLPEGWISCYCLLQVSTYAQWPHWRPMLSEVGFGPVPAEPDFRARPSVWVNSGKIENTLFFSWNDFSSFTLKSMSTFFMQLRANSLSVLGDRFSCWLRWKRKAVSFLCVQTTHKSVQDTLTMGSLQNDRYKIIFPSTSWHMAPFTCLLQLPFTCGDQIILF